MRVRSTGGARDGLTLPAARWSRGIDRDLTPSLRHTLGCKMCLKARVLPCLWVEETKTGVNSHPPKWLKFRTLAAPVLARIESCPHAVLERLEPGTITLENGLHFLTQLNLYPVTPPPKY